MPSPERPKSYVNSSESPKSYVTSPERPKSYVTSPERPPYGPLRALWRPHALWTLKGLIATRRPMDPKVLSLCLRFAFALHLLCVCFCFPLLCFAFALLLVCFCFAFALLLLRFCFAFASPSFLPSLCFCVTFAFRMGGAPLSYKALNGLIRP